ncbi:RHS repeat protein [Pseudoxanthomonas wuyuanensis]
MLVRAASSPQPTGANAYWITSDWTSVSCLPLIVNGEGEGFLARDSNGNTYRFDWMAVASEQRLAKRKPSGSGYDFVGRGRYALYATRVEDRFGNWVQYSYSNAASAPVKLDRIESSDGRVITVGYSGGRVSSVAAHGRVWTYGYSESGSLASVVLPDASAWTINLQGFQNLLIRYYQGAPGEPWRNCTNPGDVVEQSYVGTVTHPSGATGTFTVVPTRFSKAGIDYQSNCAIGNPSDPNDDEAFYPMAWDSYSVVSKTLAGPGLPTATWTYQYQEGARTTVTGPLDYARYTFGNAFRLNEGKLLKVERGTSASQILSVQETSYELAQEGMLYPTPVGISPQIRAQDFGDEFIRPQNGTTTQQDGATFSSTVNGFDNFARPLSVIRASSLGYTRTDVTAYHDNLSKWVLGQTLSVTNTNTSPNVVVSRAEYDGTTALPLRHYGPGTTGTSGKLVQTLTYNADGTVATAKDGNNRTTTLSSWYRGIPRSITYADTRTQSAVVNPSGWITQVTDENGFASNYTYDAMGRLASVAYPTGDTTVWNTTTQVFEPVAASEYGIAAGHWRQTVSTGNARQVRYFDALWRPLVTREYDTANVSGTQRFNRFTYDHVGRTTFASYPGTTDALSTGTWTEYDALGRVTSVSQDSEDTPLTTLTQYLAGLQTRVTNPRNQVTLTGYQAFDQPSYDAPVWVQHPENARTDIARDVFGKPTALTRRDANNTQLVTRSYSYDGYQQLCKAVEPETGATLMGYDGAGNLAWSSAGLAAGTACEPNGTAAAVAARKVSRTYDARNRLRTLSFPDGRGNQVWDYTLDGLPDTISTWNSNGGEPVVNSYGYNKRRLLTSESVSQPGYTWNLGYQYDGNGALTQLTYPSGLQVAFAPNALGQPTKAGTYATGVSYYPNGAVKQFTYGNGIVHSMTQNARQLPLRVQSGNATGYEYAYDRNGNPTQIHDVVRGTNYSRTLQYDGLDRLTAAGSAMFGGDHWHRFTYDAVDNLKSWKLAGVKDYASYYYEPTSNRLLSIQNTAGAAVVGLSYDVQGNLANKNGQQYAFDYGNRLREAANKETYRYDGHGRRVQASTPAQAHILSMYGQDGTLRRQEDHRTGKHYEYVTLAGSLVAKVTTVVAPGTPSLTTPGYSGNGSYTVSWTAVATATSYELQEAANGGSWAAAYSGTATSQAYTGKGSGSYGYRVRACQASSCSGWSATGTTTVELPPASAPSLSVPASAPNGTYTVSWTAVGGATTYTLEESANGGSWTSVQNTASQSKAYSGKAAGSYSYRVKACNPAGCGPTSATATIQAIYPPATAPTLTVPASSYTGSYTVSWTAVTGATSYQLEEQVGSGSWSLVHNAAGSSKAISGKAAGSYSYRIKACNTVGCGPVTAVKTVLVTLTPTAAPSISSPASVVVNNFTVTWGSVSAATTYQLQERTNGGAWTTIHNAAGSSKALSGKANASYGYQARGCNVAGCGPWSAIATTVVNVPPLIPAPPGDFWGERDVNDDIRPIQYTYYVWWSGSYGATYYELQITYGQGGTSVVNTGATTSHQQTGGGNRSYLVRACNGNGCSAWKGPVSL